MEGDTEANLLFVDASADNIGIGTSSPSATLDVDGSAIFNESGAAVDFRVEGDTEANLFFVDASADMVGIGTSSPDKKLEVNGGDLKVTDDAGEVWLRQVGVVEIARPVVSNVAAILDFKDNISDDYDCRIKQHQSNGLTFMVGGNGSTFDAVFIDGDGDVGIGTSSPAYKLEVAGAIMLEDASAPTNAAGHSGIYSSSGELNAFDASGNSTVISPHHFSLVKPSEEMAWSFYSKNDSIGQQINVDMLRAIRVLENVSGEKLVYKADIEGNEITVQKTNLSLKEKIEQQQAIIEAQKKEIETQKAENAAQEKEVEEVKADASNNAEEIEALKAQVQQLLQLIQQQESASVSAGK